MEVFKYLVEFSDQPPEDTLHAWLTLRGKRLLAIAGAFVGWRSRKTSWTTKLPLKELPFVTLFYRFLGQGYALANTSAPQVDTTTKAARRPRAEGPQNSLLHTR